MIRPLIRLLGILFWVSASVVIAETHSASAEQSISRHSAIIEVATLAQHPYWQRLLHLGKTGQSRVDDHTFFLAPDGDQSAERELLATLKAATQTPTEPSTAVSTKASAEHLTEASLVTLDSLPLCRFPARYRWLEEQGLLNSALRKNTECPDYSAWRSQVNATRVSLIFPAAYMNSPSSMYGHTFLRFDPVETPSGSLWLSWALNFGANISGDDNSILYVYKGLFGGYPGQFNMMPYYRKIQEYNRMENRDMWEYPLDLTAAEVDRLLEHVWELKDINFDYFFFDENCSYQLLELLDLIRPEAQLTKAFELRAIPADTVRAVVDAGIAGKAIFRPANRTRFDALAATLSPAEQESLIRLSQTPKAPGAFFSQQPASRQALLTQAAYDYLRLQKDGEASDPDASQRSYQLLQLINQQPSVALPSAQVPTDPVAGHFSGLARLGLGQRDSRNFGVLGYRTAYQDLLDADEGFPTGAQLEMGTLELRLYSGGKLTLEQLELVAIRSLTVRDQLFQPWSWQVKAGLERVYTDVDNRDNLVGQITAGAGVSYGFNQQRSTLFSLLNGRVEFNDHNKHPLTVGLGANLGLRHDFGPLQTLAETELMQLSSGQLRQQLTLGGQYNLTTQQGLRATFSHRPHAQGAQDNSLTLEYRRYLQ